MRMHEFVDEGLGRSSYVVDLGDGTAALVDPPRFPTEHDALIDRNGWRFAWTIDSHSHADYVTGSPGLAASLLASRGVVASVFDGGPDTRAAATGRALEVGR